MIDLAATLAHRPVVLDGGLGTLLEARGNDVTSDLWSARVLRDDPDEVRAAHAAFAGAGAEVVITASYQLGFGGRIPDAELEALLHRSVSLAREAADVVVAASVGPIGALRADGSEYTGDYGLGVYDLRRLHRRRLHVLAEAGADLLAVETIPSPLEVEALALELADLGVPAFLSVSADSTGFAAAGSRADALRAAASVPTVLAVGVNCCAPETVVPALGEAPGIPLVAYPNTGERWDAATRTWQGAAAPLADAAPSWVAAGARLVGGCCRSTPADIAAIASVLR
ncbi:homocysteine S-methyltransferase [Microbacterium sp. SORGH_AS 1204]|uniref:homocysteine S-methyltransferase n=1 Tax=Microbacterium sp. SORGH_AS_1204 TaxID=3041785 RepID=UPI00278E9CE9|nr:homocysteine S-methyltransferase [Microbacterium sp. SORGH_AS_1204]MDQ1135748.1 homocysteine S-methyltransferase [Microbacterium sp. SORGH_AS_1204]